MIFVFLIQRYKVDYLFAVVCNIVDCDFIVFIDCADHVGTVRISESCKRDI